MVYITIRSTSNYDLFGYVLIIKEPYEELQTNEAWKRTFARARILYEIGSTTLYLSYDNRYKSQIFENRKIIKYHFLLVLLFSLFSS